MAATEQVIWTGPHELHAFLVPIDSLEPWPGNPRHGDVPAIAASLRRFGQVKPVVVREHRIVAGHHVVEAARQEGWSHVAVVSGEFADEEEARAFLLADNRTSELGTIDQELLAAQLRALASYDGIGYTADDYAQIVAALDKLANRGDPPPLMEPPENPESKPGEVYELGPHRLMCGDSCNPDDVAKLLDGEKPKLCVTDPPYGVEYDPRWRAEAAEAGKLAYASYRVGRVANDDRVDWGPAWQLSPADVFYCWHASAYGSTVQESIEAARYEIRSQIIWVKPRFVISRGHYHWQHEACWYAVRKGANAGWLGDRSQTTVWDLGLDRNIDGGHGTQKPVELMSRAIRNHSGDVYEPFAGSGSTLVAAAQLERRCYAMEVDPAYCDVIRQRYADTVG